MVECGVLDEADPIVPPGSAAPATGRHAVVVRPTGDPHDPHRLALLAVVAWALVIALARAWGMYLEATGTRLILFTPPVIGGYRQAVPAGWWGALAVGVAVLATLPAAVERSRWRATLAVTTAGAAAWWLALALVDGWDGLTRGLHFTEDYEVAATKVAAGPGAFLRDYVATLPDQPIALRGHPPGFALLFGLLEGLGLGGEAWATALVIAGSLSMVPAVLVALRVVAGPGPARRAAPFLALAPAATWIVTSTDGLTMATGAWVVALLAVAGSPTATRRRADVAAVAAGVLAAATALQSYGLVLLAVPVVAVAWHQRRWRPVVVAGAVAAGLVLALGLWGFWWFAGLAATVHEYHTLELERPWSYFVVGNLGAWALALGPATCAGLAVLRHRPTWVLVGGGLGAVAIANLSGLSEGEVERIWLPFTALVLPAAGALWWSRAAVTGWLAAQVATALAFAAVIGANW
jgi:methylthioxylose transferase